MQKKGEEKKNAHTQTHIQQPNRIYMKCTSFSVRTLCSRRRHHRCCRHVCMYVIAINHGPTNGNNNSNNNTNSNQKRREKK